ncbi:MAG: HflK protein, partial [Pseudomonadota bacterium]
MAGNSGGPWGGGPGGGNNGGGDDDDRRGNRRPPERPQQMPEIDELVRKGQDQLRVLMGGRGGGDRRGGTGGDGGGPTFGKGTFIIGGLIAVVLWAAASFYTVKPEEQSVELFLGEYYRTANPGLNFAPWPLVTYEKLA